MANYVKYQCFLKDWKDGKHDFSADTLKVALSNTAPNVATHVKLADVTAVDTANVDSVTLTTSSQGWSAGAYSVVVADLTMTASGSVGPFQYAIIYNDTAANDELINYYDYGSEVTLAANDTFKLDFGANLFTVA